MSWKNIAVAAAKRQFKMDGGRSQWSGKGKTRIFRALMVATAALFMPVAAQAQDIDWLANVYNVNDPVNAGGLTDYRVEVTNSGPLLAPPTTVDITIPATTSLEGISFNGITGCTGLVYDGGGDLVPIDGEATIVCSVPELAQDEVAEVSLDVRTTVFGGITLEVDIPLTNDDLPGNNSVEEDTTVTRGSDMQLQISGPTTAPSGSQVTYVLTAANRGPDQASDIVVDFPIPTGLANVTTPAGCTRAADVFTCTIDGPLDAILPVPDGDEEVLDASNSASFSFNGQISSASGSTVTPAASVTDSDPGDPIPENDAASMNTVITGGSDVAISKTANPASVLTGDPITFTLDASYTGDVPTALVIDDTLPANYTIDSVSQSGGWDCEISGQNVSCTLPSGSVSGANISLGSVQIEATANAPGSIQNQATIAAGGPDDPYLANNSDNDGGVNIIDPTVDLGAQKRGPNPRLVVVGNNYRFRIRAQNLGTADFFGTLVLTDDLPAGMTATSISGTGFACLPNTPVVGGTDGPIVCSRDYTEASPLGAGSNTPWINIDVDITAAGDLTNAVTVSSPNPNIADGNPDNDDAELPVVSVIPTESADITVIKNRTLATLPIGDIQTFSIEIVNNGPFPSLDVEMEDSFYPLINSTLGDGYISHSFTTNSTTGMTCSSAADGGQGRNLTCNIDQLDPCVAGGLDPLTMCPIVTIQVRPGGEGVQKNNVAEVLSTTTPDADLTNNDDEVFFDTTARTDVTVSKVDTPDPASAGQDLSYVVSAIVVDDGYSSAENVTIDDTLPHGLRFVSATPSTGSCSVTPTVGTVTAALNDQVLCNLGTIGNGSQQTVQIVVQPTTATQSSVLTNNVDITTTTVETNSANNSDSEDTTIDPPELDLLVSKTDSIDPIVVGDASTVVGPGDPDVDTVYSVVVRNVGPSTAENVVVTDLLPVTHLSYRSHVAPADATCGTVPTVNTTGGTLECTFPILAAGESRTITVTARGVVRGIGSNTATVASTETALFDTDPDNNSDTEETTVRTKVDLEVSAKYPSDALGDPITSVNLLDEFNYTIELINNVGTGLSVAENVELTDTLPTGIELTGTPTINITSGDATPNSCTPAANNRSFLCEFDTITNGATVEVTAPVKVVSIATNPVSLSNTATISTTSYDDDDTNDSATGDIDVMASSLAGTVFRDFANDTTITGGTDTFVEGVTMTLEGVAHDGSDILITVDTLADGTFLFPIVPEGVYTLTRGDPGENHFTNGTSTAGTSGGSVDDAETISAISLGPDVDATSYLFPIIPHARIGVAKTVSAGPTVLADGSFSATFQLRVENLGLEALNNISLTDSLAGAAPLFGNLETPTPAATGAMTRGAYAILAAPSGSCGGENTGFEGDADTVLASGFTLGVSGFCVVNFEVRINPVVPNPSVGPSGGQYDNQAYVTGEGALSGQNSLSPQPVEDYSDNGTSVDPDSDGDANEAGENDPTPLSVPTYGPQIAVVKTANTDLIVGLPEVGDRINYSFTITNTGDLTLTNVTLTDDLTDLVLTGSPIASLAPGASNSTAYSAYYLLKQPDIDAGRVENQALVEGTDPFGNDVDDDSGSTNVLDDPTVTPLTRSPGIAVVKSAVLPTPDPARPLEPGDVISYSFAITNTGNVTLTNVRLSESLVGAVISGDPIASLAPGATDSTNFTAQYALTQPDIDAGVVRNQATATGTPPVGDDVSDLSGTATDNDTPTDSVIGQFPGLTLDKQSDVSGLLSGASPGDIIPYTFTVTNTGNVTIRDISISDFLTDFDLTGSPIASLLPGASDSTTYTGEYALKPGDISAGEVVNDATAAGVWGPSDTAIDADDQDTAIVVTVVAEPEDYPIITTDGGTTTSVLASDEFQNGQATLANVEIEVITTDPELTLDPDTGLITLAPGNPAGEYFVTYEICSIDYPDICDQTTETVIQGPLPGIEAVKTQTIIDNGDGITGVGDEVVYTITVTNTGNIPLGSVSLDDTFLAADNTPLTLDSGPDFVSADQSSPEGTLLIDEVATYEARFVLDINAVTRGGLSNSVEATGTPTPVSGLDGPFDPVNDVSDDGDDADGELFSDPTVLTIAPSLEPTGLTVTKTTPNYFVARGGIVEYSITIENENPVVSGSMDVVDVLPSGFFYQPDSAALDGDPYDVTVAGRVITFEDVPVPPLTTVVATLSVRISAGAPAGERVNHASIRNPSTNELLAPPSSAAVRIDPDPLFECSDVTGQVFDDRNGDGYPSEGADAVIEDNVFTGGKNGAVAAAQDTGPEQGIPDVKLTGVDGIQVVTDEFGRFSIPCAALPDQSGSNFILKLDPRSLPTGYRLTTENPRVVRLSKGKAQAIQFGAANLRVVRVDVSAAAFTDGEPSPALSRAVNQMLRGIADKPSVLRIVYQVPRGSTAGVKRDARRKMGRLARLVNRTWDDVGDYRLIIERVVSEAGE